MTYTRVCIITLYRVYAEQHTLRGEVDDKLHCILCVDHTAQQDSKYPIWITEAAISAYLLYPFDVHHSRFVRR